MLWGTIRPMSETVWFAELLVYFVRWMEKMQTAKLWFPWKFYLLT